MASLHSRLILGFFFFTDPHKVCFGPFLLLKDSSRSLMTGNGIMVLSSLHSIIAFEMQRRRNCVCCDD